MLARQARRAVRPALASPANERQPLPGRRPPSDAPYNPRQVCSCRRALREPTRAADSRHRRRLSDSLVRAGPHPDRRTLAARGCDRRTRPFDRGLARRGASVGRARGPGARARARARDRAARHRRDTRLAGRGPHGRARGAPRRPRDHEHAGRVPTACCAGDRTPRRWSAKGGDTPIARWKSGSAKWPNCLRWFRRTKKERAGRIAGP